MIKTFELTLSKIEDLADKLSQIPTESKIHLPNKPNSLSNLEIVKHLESRDLGITFSIGNHYYGGDLSLIIYDLNKYLCLIETKSNVQELLVVSGPNPRKIDTISILEYLQNHPDFHSTLANKTLSVAYNSSCHDQITENERLIEKLKYTLVNKVYIQITDNIEKIVSGIEFVRRLNPYIVICVCVFEPSQKSLVNFKFRPWKGVSLSTKFLSGVEVAKEINNANLLILEKLEVETIHTI